MAFSLTMFIEIKEDIIKDAIEKKGQEGNETLDLLVQMALCAKQGKHIVSVPCFLTNKECCNEMRDLLGIGYFSALDYYNRKRYEYASIIEHLSIKCIISYQTMSHSTDNVMWIVPHRQTTFEPWVETHVLTENLSDSSFYIHLAYYYIRTYVLGKQGDAFRLNYCFYPLMGGGVTIEKVLQGEIEREQHFCLALADSDKKWDGDAHLGDTAQKMIDLMNKTKPFNCKLYVMKKVREIENLIPRTFVDEYGDKAGFTKIFSYDPSFFDMKIGLSLGELYDDDVCKYWQDMLLESALFQKRNEMRKLYKSKKEFDKAVKGIAPLKKGFGNDLLCKVIGDINFEKKTKKYSSKMLDKLYHIKPEELTEAQKEEWRNIGRLIFSWTCCLKAKY